MTDQSPEPRDPWAPPEQRAAYPGNAPASPGGPPVAPVHEQVTMTGIPGAPGPSGYASPAPYGSPTTPMPAASGPGATPAYGYPAQPDPAGRGYPAAPGYGYPEYPAPAAGGYAYSGQPAYAYPPQAPPASSGMAVTALVLGILSVVACVTMVGSIALGIAAVVFGALGWGRASRGQAGGGGMAMAGVILGSVGIVLGLVMTLLVVFDATDDGSDGYDGGDPPSVSDVRERV
ncbi:DUF4190 domain-containing protein [Streptomyces sp. NPDC001568]|uniref:DUF4190 domain-containing protein n=1 Tax=Streptomyces sp. NPDC001568 TaxID=3364588 RepID=UPI003675A82E